MQKSFYLNFSIFLFLLLFISCKNNKPEIIKIESSIIVLDTINVPEDDSACSEIIASYKSKIAPLTNIIGHSEIAMAKEKPEGLLNNFVADLIFEKGKIYYKSKNQQDNIDFCLLNMGSLRKSLPKGKITEADIYELMPFNNKLVVITLSGEKTNELLEYIASQGGEVVANFKMKIKNKKPQDVFIEGKAFDINKKYRILTYDYLASGGDNMKFFLEPIKMELIDIVGRDAILEYIIEETEKGNKLNAQLDGRICN